MIGLLFSVFQLFGNFDFAVQVLEKPDDRHGQT